MTEVYRMMVGLSIQGGDGLYIATLDGVASHTVGTDELRVVKTDGFLWTAAMKNVMFIETAPFKPDFSLR
jgi:hypothetical protein